MTDRMIEAGREAYENYIARAPIIDRREMVQAIYEAMECKRGWLYWENYYRVWS